MIADLIATYKALRAKGILGMNQRNADFIQRYNPRCYFPLVDNKLKTKALAQEQGIAVPELLAVITIEHQISQLAEILAPHTSFVVKPAQGSGGDGIIVIKGKRGSAFIQSNDSIITAEELSFHISNILSGMYSLGGYPDVAMIEERVIFDPIFEHISYLGVPDIRVIVCKGYPVMAMLRLPTRDSHGKANLHQGAVGVGIDLCTGITLGGVQHNAITGEHPDTGILIEALQIPRWERLLELCARCYELTGMGYLGVDLVLDKHKGPLVLELNARPGLAIQLANREGLLPRLDWVEEQADFIRTPIERVSSIMGFVGAPYHRARFPQSKSNKVPSKSALMTK
jgi:alpha-L-glutamate ligase-like protein